jgi:hypothetical protein
MENLKDFKSYSINEKIGWKEILVSLIVIFGTRKAINTYREYDYVKSVYSKINSKESIPTKEETEKLEKIRIDLIGDIESDDKWNKFGKTGILDSIRNIKFKVMDSDKYINDISLACYINIEGIKNDRKYLKPFLNAPNENDIIAIRRDVLDRKDVSLIVSHELYHYLDKLTKLNKELSNFIDLRVKSDDQYASKKYSILSKNAIIDFGSHIDLFSMKYKSGQEVDLYSVCKDYVDPYKDKFKYYSSNKEVFARWLTLKTDMFRKGIIENVSQDIKIEDISRYLDRCNELGDTNSEYECQDIMMALDWSKLDQFQKSMDLF